MDRLTSGEPLVAGVELGGTKCIAVLARGQTIVEYARWPTRKPSETLNQIADQLHRWASQAGFEALGVASFGPLMLDPLKPAYGHIAKTPKPNWSYADVLGTLSQSINVPVGFDTDVAGAALAEGRWGASNGCRVHVYITVGTGVGAAVVVDDEPVHGMVHPEIGHIRIRRDAGDRFAGTCPFHGDCLEGLVSGPAIAARAGKRVIDLGEDDSLWDLVATELSELMMTLILTISPQRIVIGGGVAERRPMLFERIHSITSSLLNGYMTGHSESELQHLVVPPRLGQDAGPLGAIALGLASLG